MGGRFRRERICVYLWPIHVVVQQKPTQHCKAIIPQLKIHFKKCKKKKNTPNRTKQSRFLGTSLVVQWLRICLPMETMQVRPLVRELSSHMPCGKPHLPRILSLRVAMKIPNAPRPETAKKKKKNQTGFLLCVPLYLQGWASSLTFGHIPSSAFDGRDEWMVPSMGDWG